MTAPGSPAETLRSAAKLMRDAAGKAPAFPWRVEPGHLGGMPEYVRSVDDGEGTVAECWREPGAAAYVAGMHPGVALAVADWLDSEARHADGGEGGIDCTPKHPLAVARAYLGEVPGGPVQAA